MAEEQSFLDLLLSRGLEAVDRVIDRELPTDELDLDLLTNLISRAEAAETAARKDQFQSTITGTASTLTAQNLLIFGAIGVALVLIVPVAVRALR